MNSPSNNSNDPYDLYYLSKDEKSRSTPNIYNSMQERLPLHNSNDPYDPYYLSIHENSCSLPNIDNSTQERLPSQKLQNPPKLPMLDILIQWLPAWAYIGLKGFGSLIGLALAIAMLGFALHFIIVHSSSLF
jgi:hypothetical protein